MMHRRVALVALVLSITSCGGAPEATVEEPRPEPPPLTGAALLPADLFFVAKLDFSRLRESSNWDVIASTLLAIEENVARTVPSMGNGELRRWVSLLDETHFGLATASAGQTDTLAVVEGRFTTDEANTTLTALQQQARIRPRPDAELPTFVSDDPPGEIVLIEDGLGVGATSGRASEIVRRHASRSGQSPFDHPEVAALVQRVNFERDAFGAVAVFTPEAKATIGPGLDARLRMVLDVAQAGAMRVGLADGVDALAIVTTTDPSVAATAVTEIERQRDGFARQPVVLMMGLGPILNGIGANAENGDIRVSLRASHEDTRNILGRASSLAAAAIGEMLAEALR